MDNVAVNSYVEVFVTHTHTHIHTTHTPHTHTHHTHTHTHPPTHPPKSEIARLCGNPV